MNEDIKVHILKRKGRENFSMRYLDPFTNRHVERSTGVSKQREAEKIAAKWEAELQEGRYQKKSRMPWYEFRECYEMDGAAGLRDKTVQAYISTLNAFETHCNPKTVADLTTAKVTGFVRELRKPRKLRSKDESGEFKVHRLTEASVARHLRHLKAICRWAHRQGIIHTVPTFDMPKRSSGATRMKGRPITTEEFERMLQVTPKVMGDIGAESWKLFMRALWASGLRVAEALTLRWDDKPGCVSVRLDGHRSILVFDADSQKSGKVELVPLAPEAVALLEPHQRERGYVFNLLGVTGKTILRRSYLASKYIGRIGEKAGVIVDTERGKFASAHDLRRAFGHRWSRKVMPAVLKELMRHSSIETTMTYYVGQNAQATAAELWKISGDILGGAPLPEPSSDTASTTKNPTRVEFE